MAHGKIVLIYSFTFRNKFPRIKDDASDWNGSDQMMDPPSLVTVSVTSAAIGLPINVRVIVTIIIIIIGGVDANL